MKIAGILALVLLILAALYVLALRGRRGNPNLAALRLWRYAHRGLHDEARPENSLAAFRAALAGGYGAELDVHLLADGGLAVIHDSQLKRVTGAPGQVEDLTEAQLGDYFLGGTEQVIPTFGQVLALFAGKAPLIVELKSLGDNYARLTETVCRALESYDGPYCLESFDPRCIRWLRKHRPALVRGQLSTDFMRAKSHNWVLRFGQTCLLANFLTRPDFVAYEFCHRKSLSNWLCRKLWGVQGVSWTVKSQQELDAAEAEGNLPIFEGFAPKARATIPAAGVR